MLRLIDFYLHKWAKSERRKPLLLRGARQVGKTFAVRQLGKTFERFVEVNFEEKPQLKQIFAEGKDLTPDRIIRELSLALKVEIIPGKTLLFLDEIQLAPQAIIALRYFYEERPELHVIAAGSLLEFAIEKVGVPVGRVQFFHLYPMNWIEFLKATGNDMVLKTILDPHSLQTMSSFIHEHILSLLRDYLVIGGMPEAVAQWAKTKDPLVCGQIHQSILQTYRQDFHKYAKSHQIKYVELMFDEAIRQLGDSFKFSKIQGEYRKRELAPALELLKKANLVHYVRRSNGQGLPLGGTVSSDVFKLIFLDVGLTQSALGLDIADWFLNSATSFINKGKLIEAFVGQELLTYADPMQSDILYYWQRNKKGSEAEVDYLVQMQGKVIPIEVKSGNSGHLKSLHLFLNEHTETPFGLKICTQPWSQFEKIMSYPLYAVPVSVQWNIPEELLQ